MTFESFEKASNSLGGFNGLRREYRNPLVFDVIFIQRLTEPCGLDVPQTLHHGSQLIETWSSSHRASACSNTAEEHRAVAVA